MNTLQISLVILDIFLFGLFILGINYLGYLITFKENNYRPLVKIINIILFVLFNVLTLAIILCTFFNF